MKTKTLIAAVALTLATAAAHAEVFDTSSGRMVGQRSTSSWNTYNNNDAAYDQRQQQQQQRRYEETQQRLDDIEYREEHNCNGWIGDGEDGEGDC